MDPRSHNKSKKDVVGFVKRPALYGVGDDLKVKSLSSSSCLSYVKELSLPLDDLEVKVITIGEAEVKWLLLLNLSLFFFRILYCMNLFDPPPMWSTKHRYFKIGEVSMSDTYPILIHV
jgi:hypothetical protein